MSEALKQTRIDETVGMDIDGQFRTFAEIKTLVRAALSRSAPDREALRNEQALCVMPLIGPLLDAWDRTPNDFKSDLLDQYPSLHRYLKEIEKAMLAESPSESAPAPEGMGRDALICDECGRPDNEHAREGISLPNASNWEWKLNACPIGEGPFHPTKTFRNSKWLAHPTAESGIPQNSRETLACGHHPYYIFDQEYSPVSCPICAYIAGEKTKTAKAESGTEGTNNGK